MPSNAQAPAIDEKAMIVDGLNKIIAELIPAMPDRLKKLTGKHSANATVEYRGNTITYRIDEQGEIIAMTSAEPSTVYSLGQSNIINSVDLFSCPEHDVARAFILYWHTKIELQLSEAARQLELEHEIFAKFDAAYDPKKAYFGLR